MVTEIVDTVVDFIGGLAGSLSDTIVGELVHAISTFLGTQFLLITQLVMELVHAAYSLFSVFAGMTKINWDGEYTYLFDVFFRNSAINGVYWGMTMIGAVLLIAFCIVAVIRKMFDMQDQERRSLGQILGSAFRGFLVIISMTAIMTAATSLTNVLIQQVSYVFDQGATLTKSNECEFTDEQFATMARIYNTIGNYSLNPGYSQHYNLNACYNEIRPDLLYLQNQGIFDFVYPDEDVNGNPDPTWQSELQKLIFANDPNHALKMDPYYEGVSNVLLEIMTILQTDAEFYPLESIRNNYHTSTEVPLDRVLFISGTMNAANNEAYNRDASFDDGLRGAFYTGEKSIYNILDVTEAFDISLGSINYLVILLGAYWVLKNLFRCLLNCTSRIVNIIGLYIAAPPIAASIPLDGGQRFREWTKSMVIQLIGIFGNIIPMRLVMLFLPIVLSSKLTLLESTVTNVIAKVFLVWGMLEAVGRFNGILTGVLANNGTGGALRGIESMNKTSDTRFSRYGGKYVRGTTDVDDPTGRGRRAEKQHEAEMREQRSYQQRQNSAGMGSGQASGAAMKAAGLANPAMAAAMAVGKAMGGGGSGGNSQSGSGGGSSGNSGGQIRQAATLAAGAMVPGAGAGAGAASGGIGGAGAGVGGMGGQKNEGGLSGGSGGGGDPAPEQEAPSRPASAGERSGQPEDAGAGSKSGDIANGAQHNGSVPQDGGTHEKPVSEMTEAEKQEARAAVFGPSGNDSAKASSAPDSIEEQTGSEQPAEFENRSTEERKKAFDSLFGEGQADPATGRPIRQSNAAQRGSAPKRPVPPPRPKQGPDRK